MRHHGNGHILIFAAGARITINPTEVTTELNRAPARLDQRPAQPLVALPQQPSIKHPAAAGVSRRHHAGLGRQFRRRVKPSNSIDFSRDHAAKKRTDSRDALQQLFLCALGAANLPIELFNFLLQQLCHLVRCGTPSRMTQSSTRSFAIDLIRISTNFVVSSMGCLWDFRAIEPVTTLSAFEGIR